MHKRKLLSISLIVCLSISISILLASLSPSIVSAQVGTNIPSDDTLQAQRVTEFAGGKGFVVQVPGNGTKFKPVQRVPRDKFGVVGSFPLALGDLDALVYPDASLQQRLALLEGVSFFTTPHTVVEGAGPIFNQPFCLGCHLSSAQAPAGNGLVQTVSNVSRAGRESPTNFRFTSLDPATGGGRPANNLDAINSTGRTAAFTIFGDFSPRTNYFDALGGAMNPQTGFAQQFGGFVQHTRTTVSACLPDRIPTIEEDKNLGVIDQTTRLSQSGFRRSVSERAGPPYIGRGLMEAIPTQDILSLEDPSDTKGPSSSLNNPVVFGCTGDCVTGQHNEIPVAGGFAGGVGRFGLRANGVEMLQFVSGGFQGEVGFTSRLNNTEINVPDINLNRPGCKDTVPDPEGHISTPFSLRNFLRMTAPPEFGQTLLALLKSPDPSRSWPAESAEAKVQRGAQLFGIDLIAFADRMIPGRMPASGDDGRDPHAINQGDTKVSCVVCHTPIQRTGKSPAVGQDAQLVAQHLNNVWAPIFSDLLLHKGPVIDAERFSPRPRDPLPITRPYLKKILKASATLEEEADNQSFSTFDLPRNLADDAFTNQQGTATGDQFRTPPLMGLGRMGTPFLHDARVYLSQLTRDSNPAGTVMTNSEVTNAPLVVRTIDDAIRAVIELHDLPAPDDDKTLDTIGGGCPVPPSGSISNVSYGQSPQDVICPPYNSSLSNTKRSEAREVTRRFRALSAKDQQAMIEFLKEL